MSTPCVLTIGGLDPSGGAGLPADARAVAAFGAHACGITTAVIAQNTRGVACFETVSPVMLAAQLDHLLDDITPHAIKIGMLPEASSVRVVAERMEQLPDIPLVIDTVFAPSSGPAFSGEETIHAIIESLLPLADFVTPNLLEAAQLTGLSLPERDTPADAASFIHHCFGARHVLIKGGHWRMEGAEAVDVFFDGRQFVELSARRVHGYEVRGTGCLLASAIAAQRAQGVLPLAAARQAKSWLTAQIENAVEIGGGRRVAAVRGPVVGQPLRQSA